MYNEREQHKFIHIIALYMRSYCYGEATIASEVEEEDYESLFYKTFIEY
jgi:hypothetical protein